MRTLLILPILFASCATGPVILEPDGTKIILSASLLEKTTDESAAVRLANGTELAYSKKGKDQTMLAREVTRGYFSVEGVKALWGGQNTSAEIAEKGQTARQVSSDSVQKARIDGDVKIKTFVPPEP